MRKRVWPSVVLKDLVLVVVISALLATWTSIQSQSGGWNAALGFSWLLAGITAGFALTNLSPNTSRRLFSSIDNVLPTTYVIFFATTGAKISLDSLMIIWPLALGVCAVRFFGCWSGLRIGCRVARASDLERKWLWTAMVSQAGVSIALASEIHRVFAQQEWATQLQSFMLATIVINEVFGPPLMRLGVMRSGEAHA